jgi:ABC-2 type transport system ATP-binding protein
MPHPLSVNNLSKKYDSFQAIAPVTFALNAGEIVVLSGPNGSGKTTLLSCLAGLIPLSSGEIYVSGFHLYQAEVEARRRLMFVPDVPQFYLELTAWEHLKFMAYANQAKDLFERQAESLMREFSLWEAKDLYPHHYSRGMRLKLGIVMALVRPFDVLMLDEPSSALDQESIPLLIEKLDQLKAKGAAILISSHDQTLTSQIADKHIHIQQGRLAFP